jgi:hypothetical protein
LVRFFEARENRGGFAGLAQSRISAVRKALLGASMSPENRKPWEHQLSQGIQREDLEGRSTSVII